MEEEVGCSGVEVEEGVGYCISRERWGYYIGGDHKKKKKTNRRRETVVLCCYYL